MNRYNKILLSVNMLLNRKKLIMQANKIYEEASDCKEMYLMLDRM